MFKYIILFLSNCTKNKKEQTSKLFDSLYKVNYIFYNYTCYNTGAKNAPFSKEFSDLVTSTYKKQYIFLDIKILAILAT